MDPRRTGDERKEVSRPLHLASRESGWTPVGTTQGIFFRAVIEVSGELGVQVAL